MYSILRKIAQSRRFELAAVEAPFRPRGQTRVGGVEVEPVVVELVVGVKGRDMAVETIGLFGVEEEKALFLLGCKLNFSRQPAVVFALGRDQGAFELGDGLDDEGRVDGRAEGAAGFAGACETFNGHRGPMSMGIGRGRCLEPRLSI